MKLYNRIEKSDEDHRMNLSMQIKMVKRVNEFLMEPVK